MSDLNHFGQTYGEIISTTCGLKVLLRMQEFKNKFTRASVRICRFCYNMSEVFTLAPAHSPFQICSPNDGLVHRL